MAAIDLVLSYYGRVKGGKVHGVDSALEMVEGRSVKVTIEVYAQPKDPNQTEMFVQEPKP